MATTKLWKFKSRLDRLIDYAINGDVYNIGYTYNMINSSIKSLSYNDTAKDEVSELYEIFNS